MYTHTAEYTERLPCLHWALNYYYCFIAVDRCGRRNSHVAANTRRSAVLLTRSPHDRLTPLPSPSPPPTPLLSRCPPCGDGLRSHRRRNSSSHRRRCHRRGQSQTIPSSAWPANVGRGETRRRRGHAVVHYGNGATAAVVVVVAVGGAVIVQAADNGTIAVAASASKPSSTSSPLPSPPPPPPPPSPPLTTTTTNATATAPPVGGHHRPNVTAAADAGGVLFDGGHWWALLAVCLVLATAAGNILVCLAITWERRLQNVTNYFLMSLAVTDLMVAVLVMPVGILTLIKGQ